MTNVNRLSNIVLACDLLKWIGIRRFERAAVVPASLTPDETTVFPLEEFLVYHVQALIMCVSVNRMLHDKQCLWRKLRMNPIVFGKAGTHAASLRSLQALSNIYLQQMAVNTSRDRNQRS